MADRKSWSSSEGNFSDESDSDLVNLCDSDVENSVVPVEHSGPRPYQFEPRRVRQNEQQETSNKKPVQNHIIAYDNNSNRLGNTDWY